MYIIMTSRKQLKRSTILIGILASTPYSGAFQNAHTTCTKSGVHVNSCDAVFGDRSREHLRSESSRLFVLSTPPRSETISYHEEGDSDVQTSIKPLFDMDDEEGDDLYQVEQMSSFINEDEKPTPFAELVMGEVETEESEEDLSFYYRDEDDMLTEREDRLYIDAKGFRRTVEKCFLVGVEALADQRKAKRDEQYFDPLNGAGGAPTFTLDESLIEMRDLIKTAGMEVVGELTQRLQEVNPKTYIGTGKVKEAQEMMEELGCTTVVFDAELTPGQQKHLENIFNRNLLKNDFLVQDREIKVVDRTALILDIFAQHAKTREGKLQVDLALHEYRKPRLTKMWTHLERQSGAGGVGLRGPGESQLEIDKRLVRDRIIVLKKKIDDIQKQRSIHRLGRKRTGLPVLSIVGYTNAGKSSLLNYLTRAGVMAESMLFATLDPTTRKVKLPGYRTHPEVLLTDTVGFIQKLPTNLVAAFRATLEEVQEADVLVHVIDVSNPTWEKQERAVNAVLADIGVDDKPIVRVLNKIDLLDPDDAEYLRYEAAFSDKTVPISALYGDGLQDFVACVEEALSDMLVPIEVMIPYNKGEELNMIHEQVNVETIDYRPNGTYVLGRVSTALANRLAKYSLAEHEEQVKEVDEDEIDWVAIGRGRHSVEND